MRKLPPNYHLTTTRNYHLFIMYFTSSILKVVVFIIDFIPLIEGKILGCICRKKLPPSLSLGDTGFISSSECSKKNYHWNNITVHLFFYGQAFHGLERGKEVIEMKHIKIKENGNDGNCVVDPLNKGLGGKNMTVFSVGRSDTVGRLQWMGKYFLSLKMIDGISKSQIVSSKVAR